MPSAAIDRHNNSEGKHLGQRHGQPDTLDTQQQGQSEKAGHHEHEPAQDGDQHGRARPLDALEIADRHDIHGKEYESRREQRKPPDGNVVSRVGVTPKKASPNTTAVIIAKRNVLRTRTPLPAPKL